MRYNVVVQPLPAELLAALSVGIATVDAAGGWVATNAAMERAIGGRTAAPAALGLDADAVARLYAGEVVEHDCGGRRWRLGSHRGADGSVWVTLEDTTSAHRADSATFELARLRAMARVAATLVHDFNNLLNSAIGLAAQAEMSVSDPVQRGLVRELGGATQQGAQLARTLARLLARGTGECATVAAKQLLDEAVTVSAKAAAHRSVRLVVANPTDTPVVRTVVAEVVQALWQVLLELVDRGPRRIDIALAAVAIAVGGGRPRPCVRFRFVAAGLTAEAIDELMRLGNVTAGVLPLLGTSPTGSGLVVAALVATRQGGELLVQRLGDDLQLDFVLPALR
ncbi:MAG: HAMP domain-containing histidine kinase [Planctomycetes bacterium]|nr:HAMP domain-containing histidine kinase [Planctomycetota bacterium]